MKRNKHSLSYYHLTSMNMGDLVPIGLTEVLAGDTLQHATSLLARVAPLDRPVMHPCHAKVHHWFVPFRLIWEDWEKFITGGPDGLDASVFPTRALLTIEHAAGTLANYLGVPNFTGNITTNALPFRAYNLIYNEWYRDQDLQNELDISVASGVDSTTDITMMRGNWQKDYFTTCRPFEAKGPDLTIPMTGSGVVTRTSNAVAWDAYIAGGNTKAGGNTMATTGAGVVTNTTNNISLDPKGGLEVDLDDANEASLYELRLRMALLRYQEARARYGSRYTEYLRYLGVRSSDARLQRPEYLGGGKNTLQFSEVLQTGVTTDGDPEGPGELLGHGIGSLRSNRYRRFFEEHGYVVSLMHVVPKTIYMQSMDKLWWRRTKEDFWQRELEHIGQEAVLYGEVKANHATPTAEFGWNNRYESYRRSISRVSGTFQTTNSNWHYGRDFSSADPELNSSFVESNPTTRVYQDTSAEQLAVMVNHSIQARRLVTNNTGSRII